MGQATRSAEFGPSFSAGQHGLGDDDPTKVQSRYHSTKAMAATAMPARFAPGVVGWLRQRATTTPSAAS